MINLKQRFKQWTRRNAPSLDELDLIDAARMKELILVPAVREDEQLEYQRIYYQTDYPGTITIAAKHYSRKHQDAAGCTTLGWVVYRKRRDLFNGPEPLRVEGL